MTTDDLTQSLDARYDGAITRLRKKIDETAAACGPADPGDPLDVAFVRGCRHGVRAMGRVMIEILEELR